jgi:hypothetical protein
MLDLTTARLGIDERNRIRADAHLPLLSPAQELRRLYEADRERQFEEFLRTSPLRARVEERLLARIRRLRREPQWKPTGLPSRPPMSGIGCAGAPPEIIIPRGLVC